jgi:hypothetical protein
MKPNVDLGQIPVVTRDQVKYGKPDPDLFVTSAALLRVWIENALVSATVSGTCWLRNAPARSASAYCPEVMAATSSIVLARVGSTKTRPTSSDTSMRSAAGIEKRP